MTNSTDLITQYLATQEQQKKHCVVCTTEFVIYKEDIALYKKLIVPLPTHCPDCRAKRRWAFRNERKLYKRLCDGTGKEIISTYSPDKPYKVYDTAYWWSDHWDPKSYGKPYNPEQSVFHQIEALVQEVPHQALIYAQNENCGYCHLTANCKDSYLVVESSNAERCLYGYWLQKCTDCVDTAFSYECELCYEVDNCYNCYNVQHSQDATNCRDSKYLLSCIGCKNCYGCANLVQKEYCILNVQYTKEEYEKKIQEVTREEVEEFLKKTPRKWMRTVQSEQCTGDYIMQSKDCFQCFHAHEAEHCRYAEHIWRNAKEVMDVSTAGRGAELIYESINIGIDVYNVRFSIQCWNSKNMTYSIGCQNSQECFGCVNLKNAKYCIFNVQYTKEEYEVLKEKIIMDMLKRGEYGEFFPPRMSMLGYNETVAQEYYPLTEEASDGWKWSTYNKENEYHGTVYVPHGEIEKYHDPEEAKALLSGVLRCSVSGKPYKIIPQELAFYLQHGIAIPALCPDERHLARMRKRNIPRLQLRVCDCTRTDHGHNEKCTRQFSTSYTPEQTEQVYCEECFGKEIY